MLIYFPDFAFDVRNLKAEYPMAAPTIWAAINAGTDEKLIPENESVRLRAIVTAGLAKEVDEVKK